jgi:hypothetical protein
MPDERQAADAPSVADVARTVSQPDALVRAVTLYEHLRLKMVQLRDQMAAAIRSRGGADDAAVVRRIAVLAGQQDALAPELAKARLSVLGERQQHIWAVTDVLAPRSRVAAGQARAALAALHDALAEAAEIDEQIAQVGGERRARILPTLLADLDAAVARLPSA